MTIKQHILYPRVLIISHNALSNSQDGNGRTLSAFFGQWDTNSLAQVYLTTDIPEFTVCKKFFQINDVDILKRFFLNKKIQGKVVLNSDLSGMEDYKKVIKKSKLLNIIRNNMSPFVRFLRDSIWSISGYKTGELIKFIDEFNPQVVFFLSGNSVFSFALTKWICKTKKIPLIMQTTDDYVTGKFSLDPFFWIQLFRLKCAYQWAVSYSDCVIAIGDKMAVEYKIRFGGNYFVAMNSISNFNPSKYTSTNQNIKFTYAGNLGLNRWKILALIGESLAELSHEEGINGELAVYALTTPEDKQLLALNIPPFCSFKGGLNNDQLTTVREHSDFLVHVEAFDNANKYITRLSISTKIPEYLASERCIFAVGPKDVASMQYLMDYDLGVTVISNKKTDIKKALKEIILNTEMKIKYAKQGVEVAKTRHNAIKTAESIFQIISSTVEIKH